MFPEVASLHLTTSALLIWIKIFQWFYYLNVDADAVTNAGADTDWYYSISISISPLDNDWCFDQSMVRIIMLMLPSVLGWLSSGWLSTFVDYNLDADTDADADAAGRGWLWIFPRRRSIPSNEGSRPFRPIYQSPPRAIPTHHHPIPFQLPQPLSAFSRGPLLMLMLTQCCCCHSETLSLINISSSHAWVLTKAMSYFQKDSWP